MIIVYQSLESTGGTGENPSIPKTKSPPKKFLAKIIKRDPIAYSAITGNIFKNKTQDNIEKLPRKIAKRKNGGGYEYEYIDPTWDPETKMYINKSHAIDFASSNDSKARFKKFSEEKEDKKRKENLEGFLTKVIRNIKLSTMKRTATGGSNTSCRVPDLIVLGEIYGNDIKNKCIGDYIVIGGMDPTGDPRHRFTIFKHILSDVDKTDIKIFPYTDCSSLNKSEEAKCVMIKIKGWLTAFVHTPNSICNIGIKAATYIRKNVERALKEEKGLKLDLLVGDTNQRNNNIVGNYMSVEYDKKEPEKWETSIINGEQEIVGLDGYHTFSLKGTNSVFDKHFDIACTRHAAFKIQNGKGIASLPNPSSIEDDNKPVFVFHGLTDKFIIFDDDNKAYAYSDHNGIIVEILQDKEEHFRHKQKLVREKMNPKYDKQLILFSHPNMMDIDEK